MLRFLYFLILILKSTNDMKTSKKKSNFTTYLRTFSVSIIIIIIII